MYYLLTPPAQMLWIDLPTDALTEAARNGTDLGALDWRDDTDKKVTPLVLRAALAHGVACSRGIAVEPYPILDVLGPDEARQLLAKSQSNEPIRRAMDERTAAILEAMSGQRVEGWTKEGDRLAEKIDAAMAKHVEEREEEAAEVLAAPIKPELEEHWRALGGVKLAF